MTKMIFAALSGIVMLVATSHAETVSIDDYLRRVMETHPFFVKEQMQPGIERLGRNRFLGGQDWVANSSQTFSWEKAVNNSTFAPDRVYALGSGGGVEKTYWKTGGKLSLSWQSLVTDQTLPGITIPGPGGMIDVPTGASRFYENKITATYSHPLLQNRGGELDRLAYDLGGFDVDMSEVQALENQENFLLDVATRFVDWAQIAEETQIIADRLRFAEKQREQTVRKRRVNLVDEVDVLRADDAVHIAEESLVFNRSRLKAKQAELAVLSRDEGIYNAEPDMDFYAVEAVPDVESAVARIGGQRVVQVLRIRNDQLARQQRALEDRVRGQLFLNLSGGLQKGDESFSDALGLDRPDVSVSLDFRYPLGNRAARADAAQVRLRIRQLDKEIENVSLELESQLRSAWIQIAELQKVLDLNRAQIETARKKTKEESRLYDQGRVDLTFVIQSRDSEALAKLRYAANAAAYHKLNLAYRALVDDLLPNP